MTTPKCPKCDATTFASTTIEPQGSRYKVTVVHCAACGCVAGAQDNYYVSGAIQKITEHLGIKFP